MKRFFCIGHNRRGLQDAAARRRRTTPAWWPALGAALMLAGTAAALGPHELLLLVNRNSYDSLTIANHYIALRGVPLRNVVYLDLPDAARAPESEFTPKMFTDEIWLPAQEAIQARGLNGHVTVWVFSSGFPTRIGTDPKMSIHGLTFARNEAPESEDIRLGRYASPLFRGPGGPGAPTGPSLSLEQFSAGLGSRMPIPSMTLAHTGARGCPTVDAVNRLARSARADGTHPEGAVFFVTSDDVRSKTRQWQYEPAVHELEEMGRAAEITGQFPDGAAPVAGLMMGAAQAAPRRARRFAPGAMTDHLTSWAAYFDNPDQTKITAWLQAGADTSAGTVTEPMSIWTKFPAARFYAHYGRGCTLLESFYQSVASPVQLLMVGDPLLAPWKPELTLTLDEAPAGPDGARIFRARLHPEQPADYAYLVDDRLVAPMVQDAGIRLSPGQLHDRHRLRVVAYTRGPIRHQAFAEKELAPAAPVSSPALRIAGTASDPHARTHPLRIELEAEGETQRIRLYAQGREIGAIEGAGPEEIVIDPDTLGAGPVLLEAVAERAGGATRRSPRHTVVIEDRPPAEPRIERREGDTPGAEIREGDPERWAWTWMGALMPRAIDLADTFSLTGDGETGRDADGILTLSPADRDATILLLRASDQDAYEVLLAPPRGARGEAGLVVRALDDERFLFFGWDARRSAWMATSMEGGRTRRLAARGAPTPRADQWFRLDVSGLSGDRIEFRVDGEHIFTVSADRPRQRRRTAFSAGLRAVAAEARFRRFLHERQTAARIGGHPFRLDAPEEDRADGVWLRGVLGTHAVHKEIEP